MTNYVVLITLIATGLTGALANYVVQLLKGQLTCSLNAYLYNAMHYTLGSVGAITATALSVMSSGLIDVTQPIVFATMFSAGYTLDNFINRSTSSHDK